MKLNTKLVVMMLTVVVVALLIQFLLNQYSSRRLVEEIQDSSSAISEVLRKSLEDLTSESDVETSKLADYVKEAREKGIDEINIIDTEGEIIDSSDPARIGQYRDLHRLEKEKGFKALPGKEATRGVAGTIVKPYKLVVPVIVGDQQLGFVEINLLLDNIREIQHLNFMRRLAATASIFAVGLVMIFFLARRYTAPIQALVTGVRRVAAGDLNVVLPVERQDEVGELGESFNDMVAKLRERQELMQRLAESEHLSRVGQLASGIAHEIRNPLNYISLAVDHLKEDLLASGGERGAKGAELAERIKEEVRRVNHMVLSFMSYGRPLKVRPVSFSYPALLDRLLEVLADRIASQGVTVIRELPADLPLLHGDAELLRNAFGNFVSNAVEAMPDGGTLRLAACVDAGAGEVRLVFADTGRGIELEDQARIFQPYFTTKDAGIGLGLAITERIIHEHGGRIELQSAPETGTVFTVTLPLQATTTEATA